MNLFSVPEAARPKTLVCGRSPAEIVGASTTWALGCLYVVIVVCVRYSSLRRADHSSRGVLPTVVRRCVLSGNLANEEDQAHWGVSPQKQTNKLTYYIHNITVCPHSYVFRLGALPSSGSSKAINICFAEITRWFKYDRD